MKIVIIMLVMMLISFPTFALQGHVAVEVDVRNNAGMTEVELYRIFSDFKTGLQVNWYVLQWELKDGYLPSPRIGSNFFRLYAKYKLTEKINISVASLCRHFYSYSHLYDGRYFRDDTASTVIRLEYEW